MQLQAERFELDESWESIEMAGGTIGKISAIHRRDVRRLL
jgi:hypothetical protein